jgi:hypothetical protein
MQRANPAVNTDAPPAALGARRRSPVTSVRQAAPPIGMPSATPFLATTSKRGAAAALDLVPYSSFGGSRLLLPRISAFPCCRWHSRHP